MTPQTLYLIFKTHLDVGFTNYARNVTANYFSSYIPGAIKLAREMRVNGRAERFVWTTGSWLVYEYLEQASEADRKVMEEAIAAGDIAWHGLPFTTHTELMDPSLLRYGLSLSKRLDERFGKKTIAAKMTDVPGHTRGIIPFLKEAGIEFLHVGVNSASTAPDVPPVFVWKHPSGDDVIVMYHRGGYGDVMIVPGLKSAISFEHTGDNMGPQSPEGIENIYRRRREQFPDARIVASGMNAFAEDLRAIKAQLPMVMEEFGDTWIHGVGTDPAKVAAFRELCRLRASWLESGKADMSDKRLDNFSRSLLVVPEHTWGMDEKTHLNDYDNYSTSDLRKARQQDNFRKFEASWAEQRAYLTSAVDALADSPLADEAKSALAGLKPVEPDTSDLRLASDPDEWFETRHFRIKFCRETGTIIGLTCKDAGWEYASPEHPIGQLMYQVFSEADYDRYYSQYNVRDVDWAIKDFKKPGMAKAIDSGKQWTVRFDRLYKGRTAGGDRFVLELCADDEASTRFGCPKRFTIEIDLPDIDPVINITLQWFDKQACRVAEATWFSFNPQVADSNAWLMDKLGSKVSPLEVISLGNRKLHAVGKGIRCGSGLGSIAMETIDAPLVAPGRPSLLNFDNELPDLSGGMHFNLHNNIWGTNFPMWYEDDAKFRFILRPGARAGSK